MMRVEVTFKEFLAEYMDNLKKPSCLPQCIEDVCGGCTILSILFKPKRVSRNIQANHFEAHKERNKSSASVV